MKRAREICCAQGQLLSVASPALPASNTVPETERETRIPPGGQKGQKVENKSVPEIPTRRQQHAYANLSSWPFHIGVEESLVPHRSSDLLI